MSKVEEYKSYLNYDYWSISEAICLLSGYTKLEFYYRITEETEKIINRSSFACIPADRLGESIEKNPQSTKSKTDPSLLKCLKQGVENGHLNVVSYHMPYLEYKGDKVMYFCKPFDLITHVLINGFTIPKEMQEALSIYQVKTEPIKKKKSYISKINRQTTVQWLWYKYPGKSIAQITRDFQDLKKNGGFDYVFDSENRSREVVKKGKPSATDELPLIPEIFERSNDHTKFNFEAMSIAVNCIANHLFDENQDINVNAILNHPLIDVYALEGGALVQKIVQESLMEMFEYMHLMQAGPLY